jgi:hypothetical protein
MSEGKLSYVNMLKILDNLGARLFDLILSLKTTF